MTLAEVMNSSVEPVALVTIDADGKEHLSIVPGRGDWDRETEDMGTREILGTTFKALKLKGKEVR